MNLYPETLVLRVQNQSVWQHASHLDNYDMVWNRSHRLHFLLYRSHRLHFLLYNDFIFHCSPLTTEDGSRNKVCKKSYMYTYMCEMYDWVYADTI